jgi:hypothetical protein
MKKIWGSILFGIIIFTGVAHAEEALTVNLNIRSGDTIIFSETIPLQSAGTIDLNGHTISTNSVLAILNDADLLSENFEIADLQYYDSFGSFYLKCIESAVGNDCDNWQYVVNDVSPTSSIDQESVSGGETIYFYFGPTSKISLSSSAITTTETLTVWAYKYDYENNTWVIRDGINAGLTQPNPDDPFNPLEIQTQTIDANGEAQFSSIPVGTYSVGIKEDFYFPTESLTVRESVSSSGGGGSSSSGSKRNKNTGSVLGAETKIGFNLEKAFAFLISQQKENGSFGEDLYTDWIALALASGSHQTETIKLIKYLGESKTENFRLTDYERRAIALMALGLNPYNTNGENYIEKIILSFDGKQFGDINEDNDDIFALIVLQNAGYIPNEKIMNDDITFVLGRQKENGSWDESVDMTGAAMEALSFFNQDEKVKSALEKAKKFLKENQKDNGSWNNNASSTAWALQGILATSEKPEDWTKKTNSPLDYLTTLQDADGGIKNDRTESKIWETAYVISSLSGKTWNQTMQKFDKQTRPAISPETFKKPALKQKILESQNTKKQSATITTSAITLPPTTIEMETSKKNWFVRLLQSILGF